MMIFAAGLMAAALAATDGSASTTPTPAPVTTPPPAGATTAAPDPNDAMICRKIYATGSRLDYQKICKTKREWNVTSRNSEDAVNAMQKRSFAYGPKGS